VTVPALVTLHLWRVPCTAVPRALWHMAVHRRPLRRTPGVRFAKLLGTGAGRTFTPGDADPCRWGLLAAWDDPAAAAAFEAGAVVRAWRQIAKEEWSTHLRPLSSRGRWSRQEPFGRPESAAWEGPVAAVTRARLTMRRTARFWRAVPPVATDLHSSPGLLAALGIGEAPVGLQGTFSIWDGAASMNAFAYGRRAHAAVVRRTPQEQWYAEELFARFAVISARGTLDGRDPLAPIRSPTPDHGSPRSAM